VGEALESYERAVTAFRASGCSEESSALLDARENVALALSSLGRREEAEAILRSIIETRRRAFGPLDVATLKVMGKLSDCLAGDGQLDEACRMGTEVVESLRRALGDRDPLTLNRMHNHAFLLGNRHRYGEALSLERTVLDTWPGLLGEGHPHILSARQAEGIYALASGNAPLAVDCFRAVHDHPSHASANSRQRVIRDLLLGTALLESGQNDEARELLNGSADAAPEVLAPDDPWRLLGVAARGRILFLDGDARGNDSLRAARKSLAGSLPEADWRLRLATRWEEAGGG
jgi:tetratricopeptide (TPR) repeat protein